MKIEEVTTGYYWIRRPNGPWRPASYHADDDHWSVCGNDMTWPTEEFFGIDDDEGEHDRLELGPRMEPPK